MDDGALRHWQVTLFKIVLNAAGGAAGNGVFQQRMVRNDSEAIVFLLDFTDKTSQEGLSQRFRLGTFAFFFQNGSPRRYGRHASLFICGGGIVALQASLRGSQSPFPSITDPFRARRLGMQLLLALATGYRNIVEYFRG